MMTTQEFSNLFDALTSSYLLTPEFGNSDHYAFDEYEKSIFLTESQEEIILDLYNGKNIFGESFEKTEELRRFLSNLIESYSTNIKVNNFIGLSPNSVFFNIPDNVWLITYEKAQIYNTDNNETKEVLVTPVTLNDFYKIQKNPFRGPSGSRVLRLDNKYNVVELVSKYDITNYYLRFITKPNPIVLLDLGLGLSINGTSKKTECNLSSMLHRIILDRAVRKAIASRIPLNNIKE